MAFIHVACNKPNRKRKVEYPDSAFRFLEENHFRKMLNEIMDKSAFYGFHHTEEKSQRIAYLLIEMFKIRSSINILNMHPEKAAEYFELKWSKPKIGYRIIKKLCKLKSSGI